jgi:hypothetical protein
MSDPRAPMYRLAVVEVTSVLVYTQQRTRVFTGSLDELEGRYRAATRHNVLFGWWGFPFGFIWTPIALHGNAKSVRLLRELAAVSS